MRLAEATIQQAILHPDEQLRLIALEYFVNVFTHDESLMPLVIEAVRRHGRPNCYRLLRLAERLAQTGATVDWLLDELARGEQTFTAHQRAISWLLYHTRVDLLLQRRFDLMIPPRLLQHLRGPLDERLVMLSWDWPTAWAALEDLAGTDSPATPLAPARQQRGRRIIECLARHPAASARAVLDVLARRAPGGQPTLTQGLEPWAIHLAGELQLEPAIGLLVERLNAPDTQVNAACAWALGRVGTDQVVAEIVAWWPEADSNARAWAAAALEHIPSDYCVRQCLTLIDTAESFQTQLALGHCLLSHFSSEGIDVLRWLLADGAAADSWEWRERMLAVATLMQLVSPEDQTWQADVVLPAAAPSIPRHSGPAKRLQVVQNA